jgi:hypothetical protein
MHGKAVEHMLFSLFLGPDIYEITSNARSKARPFFESGEARPEKIVFVDHEALFSSKDLGPPLTQLFAHERGCHRFNSVVPFLEDQIDVQITNRFSAVTQL